MTPLQAAAAWHIGLARCVPAMRVATTDRHMPMLTVETRAMTRQRTACRRQRMCARKQPRKHTLSGDLTTPAHAATLPQGARISSPGSSRPARRCWRAACRRRARRT